MGEASTFVGLDVHKNTVAVALPRPGQPALEWSLVNDAGGGCRLIRKLEREAQGLLRCCYEAPRPASEAVLRFDPETQRPPPRTRVVVVDSRSLHITGRAS